MKTIVITSDYGSKFHYIYDSNLLYKYLHRTDGPAVEYKDGSDIWYINGFMVSCSSQEEFERSKEYREWKLKAFA